MEPIDKTFVGCCSDCGKWTCEHVDETVDALRAEVERLRDSDKGMLFHIERGNAYKDRIDRALELLHGRHESICSTVSYGDQAGCDCACGDAREALEGTTT